MKKSAFIVLLILLSIVYLSILKFQGFDITVFSRVNLLYVLLGFSSAVGVLLVRSLKYFLLLRAAGVNPGKDVVMITNYGFFSNFISPVRISEIVRSYILKARTKAPFFKALSPTVFDSLIDIAVLVFLIAVLSFFTTVSFDYTSKVIVLLLFLFLVVGILALITSKRGEKIMFTIITKAFRRFIKKDIKQGSKVFIDTSKSLMTKRKLLFLAFMLGLSAWLLEGLKFYFFTAAAGLSIGYLTALLLIAIAYLLGGAFVNPSGITQETILLVILLQLPFDKTSLMASGSIDAVISIGFVLTLGLLYTLKLGTSSFKINEAKN
jgi:uncharacterized protein (TIRG00374 family)